MNDPSGGHRRAISPVVGTILLVAITIVLASSVTFVFAIGGDLDAPEFGTPTPEDDSPSGPLYAVDASGGATDVEHAVLAEANETMDGKELSDIKVDYGDGSADPDNVTDYSQITAVGVDTDGDGEIDVDLSDDLDGINTNDNSRIRVAFDTTYVLSAGDTVVVHYEGVDNPEDAGEYDATVTLIAHDNTEQDVDATLEIEE